MVMRCRLNKLTLNRVRQRSVAWINMFIIWSVCVLTSPPVEYLVVDGAFAKASFVSAAVDLRLHLISKLRCDANLQFLYTGEQKRRGRRSMQAKWT
jgi:hypothetical protein